MSRVRYQWFCGDCFFKHEAERRHAVFVRKFRLLWLGMAGFAAAACLSSSQKPLWAALVLALYNIYLCYKDFPNAQ